MPRCTVCNHRSCICGDAESAAWRILDYIAERMDVELDKLVKDEDSSLESWVRDIKNIILS